jgi:N-acyl-D-amino-acid deacylase
MRTQPVALDCYPYCASSTIPHVEPREGGGEDLSSPGRSPIPSIPAPSFRPSPQPWAYRWSARSRRCYPPARSTSPWTRATCSASSRSGATMVGSDGLPHDAVPHPRLWGTFPRVLGHYARGMGLFSSPRDRHPQDDRASARAISAWGDRGVLKPGLAADICIFRCRYDRRGRDVREADPARPGNRGGDRERRDRVGGCEGDGRAPGTRVAAARRLTGAP